MVTATATGCYQFKINHSKTKDMGTGEGIISPKFRVGQHDWTFEYYPQGYEKENNGKYVSVYLELQRESVDVRATFEFALLDKYGTLSTIAMKSTTHTFTSCDAFGFRDFFERSKLEEMYVKDCYFVVQVKITIKDESCTGTCWNTSSIGYLCEGLQKFREENKPFFQHLLAAADRYAVEKLKATCEYTLLKSISLDTVLSTLESAEKHNCSELKKGCLQFVIDKDNLVSLVLTEGYIKLIQNYPSLLAELKDLAEK
ncbi:BTB/POZ and MATH domain-containing protein 2-like protein [Carex littledalei]|uniref:BTB/POZ and MATH domain-containing protein 2-like protein n=1 Tax=Carex littledalei TaxID=544730 RepID=A0A833QNL3_9POAL|nr:BTB/POZ and MATH domain-containing protein 2-like protein [Carex littledalei]